ncbi:proprotein convertase P-domain-containing protein, partial [bacterium]|nr:proprotein convertase P-domain-containing protein [bacterium]
MKKIVTLCTMLAMVASAAFASAVKSEKGPEATRQIIHKLDQSKVKPLPVINNVDEREMLKLELEALNAGIASMLEKGEDISAHKARANELYSLLYPARGAERLDQGGEDCGTAVVVGGIPYCDEGSTAGTLDDYQGDCFFNGGSGDVVYAYTPTADVVATVSLFGSNYDTGLHIWNGCPTSGGTQVACNDDNSGLQSCLTVTLLAATTYYIIVDGYGNSTGNYIINISDDGVCGSASCAATCDDPGPVSDDCAGAIEVPVPSVQYGSTVGMGSEALGFCGTSDGTGGGVWYKVRGNGNTYTATTCDPCSDYDTKIRVFTCGCDLNTCVTGNDDNICGGGFSLLSSVTWATDPGAMYWILVHGFASDAGNFGLVLSDDGIPSNGDGIDCPCHDETLAAPGSTSGNTTGAGNDCATRGTEDWVVEVSIPYADEWRFSLCGSGYDTYLFLGTDCCLGDIASNDDFCGLGSEICTFVPEGLIYVTIEGWSGSGAWTLNVEPCVPPVGSCCYTVPGGDVCTGPACVDNVSEGECAQLGGVWTRDGLCGDGGCLWNAPCVCSCSEHPNSHATYAVDNTTYPISETIPTTCVTINVPIEYQITDLNVSLDLYHTYDGDLDITLESPSGTIVHLFDQHGGSGDNILCATFDDEAANAIGGGLAPFNGSWIPFAALSAFDGENAVGDWLLCVTDNFGGDIGYILGVCLSFEYDEILPVAFGGFDAVAGNGLVTLNWNTLSETDVDHFELSRNGS